MCLPEYVYVLIEVQHLDYLHLLSVYSEISQPHKICIQLYFLSFHLEYFFVCTYDTLSLCSHLDDNMLSQTHLERGQFYKIGPGLSIL